MLCILHLATAEDVYQFSVSDVWRKKVWKFESETVINASVKAQVKAGFALNEHLNIQVIHDQRKIIIDLPSPDILSNEVSVSFDNAQEGWFSPELESDMYNAINDLAKDKARRLAIANHLKEAAQESAAKSVHDLFAPLMSLPQFNYDVVVTFNQQPFLLPNQPKEQHQN